MKVTILNKYDIVEYKVNHNQYNILIRITNPGGFFLPLIDSSQYRDILELKFYDLDSQKSDLETFNDNHLKKLIHFFNQHKSCDHLIIHCDAGFSRSPAVAVGWYLFQKDYSLVKKILHSSQYSPNVVIVSSFFHYYKKIDHDSIGYS